MKNIIDLLESRGFVDQISHPELKQKTQHPIRVYVGFDPTADSLHLGNLMGIMGLAWFQKAGHLPVVVLGGATGRIGDPSGKSVERPLLDEQVLAKNVEALEAFFHKILQFSSGPQPLVLNNEEWLGKISLVDFLRDTGKFFRMGSMLGKESVRARIQSEEGMSFTEFSYQALQAYDFCHLHEKHGVHLQMGGTDQWGNITAGIELQRKRGGNPLYGLTFPLLTRSDGKKFGKSEEGAIWLSEHKLSPYLFYQHLFRTPDADVIRLLKSLTFLDLQEIEDLEEAMGSSQYLPNTAQKVLAREVTLFIHGEAGLRAAEAVTEGIGTSPILDGDTLRKIAADMPNALLSQKEVLGRKFVDLAVQVGLLASKSEAVRLIRNGGAYLNHKKVLDPAFVISSEALIDGAYLLLSVGKKKRVLIQLVDLLKN